MTLEEKARKHIFCELCSTCEKRVYIHCDYAHKKADEPQCKDGKTLKKTFIAGHNEANRWRDVNVELPEVNIDVLVKTVNGKYIVAQMYIPKDCNGIVLGLKEWKGSYSFKQSIIAWRPIETI